MTQENAGQRVVDHGEAWRVEGRAPTAARRVASMRVNGRVVLVEVVVWSFEPADAVEVPNASDMPAELAGPLLAWVREGVAA